MREVTYIIKDGEIIALAGGPLSLGDMGPRTTKRVSRVEFNEATNQYEVLDPVDRAAKPKFTHMDYAECLRWEADYFNARLAAAEPLTF